jgi:hypothetical protein
MPSMSLASPSRVLHALDPWDALGVTALDGLALDQAGVDPEDFLRWRALGVATHEVPMWARCFSVEDAGPWLGAGFTDPWLADKWAYLTQDRLTPATVFLLAGAGVTPEGAVLMLGEVTDAMKGWDAAAFTIRSGTPEVNPDVLVSLSAARDGAVLLAGTIAEITAGDAVACVRAGLSRDEVTAMVAAGGLDRDTVRMLAGLRCGAVGEPWPL